MRELKNGTIINVYNLDTDSDYVFTRFGSVPKWQGFQSFDTCYGWVLTFTKEQEDYVNALITEVNSWDISLRGNSKAQARQMKKAELLDFANQVRKQEKLTPYTDKEVTKDDLILFLASYGLVY